MILNEIIEREWTKGVSEVEIKNNLEKKIFQQRKAHRKVEVEHGKNSKSLISFHVLYHFNNFIANPTFIK